MKKNNTEVVTEIVYRRNTASMREELQTAGVGVNALGTYVADKLSDDALRASLDAVNQKGIQWSSQGVALVSKGKQGTTVRFGKVSLDGLFVMAYGQHGGRGIVSTAIYGEAGTLRIDEHEAFARELATCANGSFIRTGKDGSGDNKKFEGKVVGSLADKLASLVYIHGGIMMSVDLETRANDHNAKALGALGAKNKEMLERTEAGIAAAIAGGKKVTKKKVAVKAKSKKAAEAVAEAVTELASV